MNRPSDNRFLPSESSRTEPEAGLQPEIQRLQELSVYSRWAIAAVLWATVGTVSLWQLRREIGLWLQHFTWAAVRYGLGYNRLPAVGLGLCIGMTASILIWQSRNILWGRSPQEQKRLRQLAWQIRRQGSSHPLWRWVYPRQMRSE